MAEEDKSKFENEPEGQQPHPNLSSGQWWIEETTRDEMAFRREIRECGPVTVQVHFADGTDGTCECDRARECDAEAYGVSDHECIEDCMGCFCSSCERVSSWEKKTKEKKSRQEVDGR
jgi:hypothetical protein